ISVIGTLYIVFIGRFLVPERRGGDTTADRFKLDDYFTEVTVLPGSPFAERMVADVQHEREGLNGVRLVRHGRRVRGDVSGHMVHDGDVLLVRTTPDEIVALRRE